MVKILLHDHQFSCQSYDQYIVYLDGRHINVTNDVFNCLLISYVVSFFYLQRKDIPHAQKLIQPLYDIPHERWVFVFSLLTICQGMVMGWLYIAWASEAPLTYWLLEALAVIFFKSNLVTLVTDKFLGNSCEIERMWMTLNASDDSSIFVNIMAWYH